MGDTWIPINGYPGDQRYEGIPGTPEVSYFGEIAAASFEGGPWGWEIFAVTDGVETLRTVTSGVAATEAAAKAAVETWRPTT
ncbi:Uncharacterised protein (plasmid) [Tsukamurella tyrosinosolvens]|uniref:Uncharacterized protein n=1 Tax=Tsukamurella tyrosinosolvens TaxID=57704 RepID=A0A1H4V6T2_TSUTY|nr:hypothetical protein [Tsukamurella tyrosinosolvens]SEC76626.1 hypothetical protein SAMN04489793_3158 [Tsukamurella tyrosinosolvens]VEH90655.1 Uncharacterised protein [Tsukamurella tyrosinosolvens]